uniref:Galectin n=1 Tax=Haemonchus contortus TaxID=6289 RepID=A0A7I5EEN5_HAECO
MHNVFTPTVPCAIPIRETLRPGCIIDIHGRVHTGDYRNFAVELLSGPHIILHVNFRFHEEYEVVMNSHSHGCWGEEIRQCNPIGHNEPFHLRIRVRPDYYKVEVNGEVVCRYPHRYPMEAAQAVGIKGDVIIKRVEFSGFLFSVDWNEEHDYGHAGYSAYGLDHYEPPVFHESHAYNAYFC